MKNTSLVVRTAAVAVLVLASSVFAQQATPTIAPWAHVGEVATVCGVIVDVDCRHPDVWLETEGSYSDDGVSLAVGRSAGLTPRALLGRYLLQSVCTTGRIEKAHHGFVVRTEPADIVLKGPVRELPAGFESTAHLDCDEGVRAPTVISDVMPMWPADAMRAKKTGRVLLKAVVLTDGHVGDIVVAVSLGKDLDAAAVAAFKQWLFNPATIEGRPIPVIVSGELAFSFSTK